MVNPYASPTPVTPESKPDPNPNARRRDPLSARHAFIWLGFFALVTANGLLTTWLANSLSGVRLSHWVISSVSLAYSTTCLAGLFILFESRKARNAIFEHPGHWLLLILSFDVLCTAVRTYSLIAMGSPDSPFFSWFQFGALLVAHCYFATRTRGIWQSVFVGFALHNLAILFAHFVWTALGARASLVFGTLMVITQSLVVVAAISDIWTRARRDWLHYLGVVLYLLGATSWLWWRLLDVLFPSLFRS